MQTIIEAAQPYLNTVVTGLLGALVAVALSGLTLAKGRAIAWLESRTTVLQRETLYKVAGEGFSYAETVLKGKAAQDKLDGALEYVSERLADIGISYSDDEIRAAVEKAVLDFNAKTKPQANASFEDQLKAEAKTVLEKYYPRDAQ